MADTLALVELINREDVAAELGSGCLELFLDEFEQRLKQMMRSRDEFIRIEPHKICLLLRDVRDPQMLELAGAKLERLFETPIELLGEAIRPDVRAAFVPPGPKSLDTKARIQIAEAALRDLRRTDKHFIIRDAHEVRHTNQEFRREREIEQALDRGEFVLYYQAQIHAGYRNLVGAEALMRWHSRDGVRAPAEFIPYAKKPELQRQITWFAIKSAIAAVSNWPDGLNVAVNVPPALLRDAGLQAVVSDALAIFGCAASRLTLEITEDAMIDDPEEAMIILDAFRTMGVRIAIDDFGTGYSSLSYFRDLPVDELKVDRAFVSKMLEQPKDAEIVKAIIDLAHNFSLKVVAEGVEDEATALTLQQLGCDILQGYHIGRPVPEADFLDSH